MKEKKEPKVKLSFESCYNYDKLKKEGLIIEKEKEEEPNQHPICDI